MGKISVEEQEIIKDQKGKQEKEINTNNYERKVKNITNNLDYNLVRNRIKNEKDGLFRLKPEENGKIGNNREGFDTQKNGNQKITRSVDQYEDYISSDFEGLDGGMKMYKYDVEHQDNGRNIYQGKHKNNEQDSDQDYELKNPYPEFSNNDPSVYRQTQNLLNRERRLNDEWRGEQIREFKEKPWNDKIYRDFDNPGERKEIRKETEHDYWARLMIENSNNIVQNMGQMMGKMISDNQWNMKE